jgi:hypothetical protein
MVAVRRAIGVADATGQRHGAVVREHVPVERVQGGIVDVGREHALTEIVEDGGADGAAEPAEGLFVELGPSARARLEGEQADALAAVAQGEDEQARAAVLPRDRVPHHRTVAVVDLPFFARGGHDHGMRVGRLRAAQLAHEAPHAGVPGREAVLVDQVLPDRHGVAAAAEGQLDQLPIRLSQALA